MVFMKSFPIARALTDCPMWRALRPFMLAVVLSIFLVSASRSHAQQPLTPAAGITTSTAAQPPQELRVDGQIIGERVPPQPGEICLVCGNPIGSDDAVYLVNGHRVPLHAKICYGAFNQNPWKYLAVINPHGAFLGSGGEAQHISLAWFFFGLYILLGLVFAALCAQRAVNTGHNPVAWFAAGIVLNVIAYVLLLARPRGEVYAPAGVAGGFHKIPATYSPVACAHCGTPNHPSARKCLNCGAELEAQVVSEVQKAGAR
jgi:hypothetical protein